MQKSTSAAYVNCFRLVYKISLSTGTKYLAADIYNVHATRTPTYANVFLREYDSLNAARSTADFASASYTVYELTGGSMVFSDAPYSPFDAEGKVLAKSWNDAISYADIWKIPQTNSYTLLQALSFARNELFAQAGHDFLNPYAPVYADFYNQFSWFAPVGNVTTSDLAAMNPTAYYNLNDRIIVIESLIREG